MKYFVCSLPKAFIAVLLLILIVLFGCQSPETSTKLKPLIDSYINAWNTGETDVLDEIVHPDFEFRITPTFKATVGLDSLKQLLTYYRTAYPDFHITIDDEIYAEEKVAIIWTITATNTGPGIFPATGKKIDVQGMSVYHFTEGKIFDEWIAGNHLLWYQQLGFTLTPPASFNK
ncbi:MAG: ester cyclase [bacterium]